MRRLLGVDFGLSRLGLAVSDERKIIATPLPFLRVQKTRELTATALFDSVKSYELEAIIMGLPLLLKGAMSPLAEEVHIFADFLRKKFSCPIILWDERLTSSQATRLLKDAHVNRKKRAQIVDSLSAVIILQSYLDAKTTIN